MGKIKYLNNNDTGTNQDNSTSFKSKDKKKNSTINRWKIEEETSTVVTKMWLKEEWLKIDFQVTESHTQFRKYYYYFKWNISILMIGE